MKTLQNVPDHDSIHGHISHIRETDCERLIREKKKEIGNEIKVF